MDLSELGTSALFWLAAFFGAPTAAVYLRAAWQMLRTQLANARYTLNHRWTARVKRLSVAALVLAIFFRYSIASIYQVSFDRWFWGPVMILIINILWMLPVQDATAEEREFEHGKIDEAEAAHQRIRDDFNNNHNGVTLAQVLTAEQAVADAREAFDEWLRDKGPSDRTPGFHFFITWLCLAAIGMNEVITAQKMHEWHDLYHRWPSVYAEYAAYADEAYNFSNVRYHHVVPCLLLFFLLVPIPVLGLIILGHLITFIGLHAEHLTVMMTDLIQAAADPNTTVGEVRERRLREAAARGHAPNVTAFEALGYRAQSILVSWLVASLLTIVVILEHATYTVTIRATGYNIMTSSVITLLYFTVFNPNIRRERLPLWFTGVGLVTSYPSIYYMLTGGNGYGGGPGPYHWILRIPRVFIAIWHWVTDPAKAIYRYVRHDLTGMGTLAWFKFILVGAIVGVIIAGLMYGASKVADKITKKYFLVMWYVFVTILLFPGSFAAIATVLQIPMHPSTARSATATAQTTSSSAPGASTAFDSDTRRRCALNTLNQPPCEPTCYQFHGWSDSRANIEAGARNGTCYVVPWYTVGNSASR